MLLDNHLKTGNFTFLQDCKEAMAQWNANAEASNLGASDDLRSSLITQPASKRGSPSSSLNMYTYKTRYVYTTTVGIQILNLFCIPMVQTGHQNDTYSNDSGIRNSPYLLSLMFKLFYLVEIIATNTIDMFSF